MKLINMEMPQTLHKRIQSCADHVFQGLIPNWVNYGLSPQGYSYESLALNWTHNPVGRIRLLTQCRQLYTLSHASELGYLKGFEEQIRSLFNFTVDHYFVEGRWIFSRNDNLDLLDQKSDAYALAFVLLSFSHYHRLTGDQTALEYINQTEQFLVTNMRHPKGGFYEAFPIEPHVTRRQNPHMHLLEGFVAAYHATKEAKYLKHIEDMCELAHLYFVEPKTQTLREFFKSNLTLDDESGHLVEPGHHFEWVWLLHQTYQITGRQQDLKLAAQLWHSATQFGMADNGGIINSFDGNTGKAVDAEKRIWPITEYLKACCVISISNEERFERIEAALAFMQTHYFLDNGRWVEYLDTHNNSKGFPLPGTTGYHIFLGLAEVLKWQDS